MNKKLAIVVCMIISLVFSACGNQDETAAAGEQTENSSEAADGTDEGNNVFVVGAPQPLTGTNANAGIDGINGVKLAANQINAAGGLLGHTVKVVSYDDQGTPEEAVKINSKMLEVDHVNAVIGSCISSCVLASSGALNDAQIPTFGTGTSPTWMEQGWEYVFRACQNADFAMPSLVNCWTELGIETIAVFAGQDDASVATVETIEQLCSEAGIAVVDVESYVDGDTDFSGQCAKMIDSGAEAMFISTYGSTQPLIVKQLRQYGFDGLMFTKDLMQADSISIAGEASDYVGFAYPYLTYTDLEECTVENVKEFLTAYHEEFNEYPNTDVAYRAYDSMMVLKTAVEAAGSIEGEAVKDAINGITDYVGLGGTFDYSQNDGEGLHESAVYLVLNENYILLEDWLSSDDYTKWQNR